MSKESDCQSKVYVIRILYVHSKTFIPKLMGNSGRRLKSFHIGQRQRNIEIIVKVLFCDVHRVVFRLLFFRFLFSYRL